jgi:hypothetical protein
MKYDIDHIKPQNDVDGILKLKYTFEEKKINNESYLFIKIERDYN